MKQFEDRLNQEVAAQSVYYQDVLVGDGSEPAWRDILCAPKEAAVRTPTSTTTPTSTLSSMSQLSTVVGASSAAMPWSLGRPSPSPPCHMMSPSSPAFGQRQFDNMSVRSAPPLCRSSSAQMQPGCSPPTFLRHRRNLSSQMMPYSLKTSASASAIFSKSPQMNRPQSLYVPFKGCVEQKPAPPGRAARDILNALSFAPTQDTFSAETRQMAIDEDQAAAAEWSKHQQQKTPIQPSRSSWSYSPKLPCIPQSPKLKLRAKSSSMATLIVDQTSPKILRPRPRYPPNVYPDRPPPSYSQAIQKFPFSYSTTDIVVSVPSSPVPLELTRPNLGSEYSDFVPIYSPTNPLNHAENIALLVSHPPIIHPPPDIIANSPSPSNFGRNLSSPRGLAAA